MLCVPERAVLVQVGHNDELRLREVWRVRVELVVGNDGPTHTALARTIDDTCVDLTEGLLDVVMEARADALAGGPHLDMCDLVHGVVGEADMPTDEVVEFEALHTGRLERFRHRIRTKTQACDERKPNAY